MASNIVSGGWKVRIIPIPASTTVIQVAQKIGLPNSRIRISKKKQNDTHYACIDDFNSEAEANKFAQQLLGSSVFGETIKCTVTPSRPAETDVCRSRRVPLVSPIEILSSKQRESRYNRGATGSRDIFTPPATHASRMSGAASKILGSTMHDDGKDSAKPPLHLPSRSFLPQQQRSTVSPALQQSEISRLSAARNSNKQDTEDTLRLDPGANKDCHPAHAPRETVPEPVPSIFTTAPISSDLKECDGDPVVFSANRHRSASCMAAKNTTGKPCFSGVKCFKTECLFNHPDGWNPCRNGKECKNFDCLATHPFQRKTKCREGNGCKRTDCRFLHPDSLAPECSLRSTCKKWDCQKTHPGSRAWLCTDEENCTNLECELLHPSERDELLCPTQADCHDLLCRLNHPPDRPPICDQPDACSNFNCTRLHRPDWNPHEAGDECEDKHDSRTRPVECDIKIKGKAAATTTNIGVESQKVKKKNLKSLEQRMKDREKAPLPILSCRSEFCQRLEQERVLVVTAETGSGKSTQLPQYATEYFDSFVVCTQPRVVAALSLARRVAEEYDGKPVGESVGYQVGNANRVAGTNIMFMTDAALIRESQRDPSLKHIRVLIIDEAHERSLNTDIVIGIAKILLAQRPDDFYVVIASATIDPARFLHFFDRSSSALLEVKGRVHSVTVASKPPPSECTDPNLIESNIVSAVVNLYPHHKGHTLVFLPGQREIERALGVFISTLPVDCIALPLYGSQPPEDQEKVMKFNEKSKRMVVFCTNVAETSLTIPDVQLVIDSGWAKEARYDVKRRLTVIETVRISRSSADQRKGRAGRTAPGHCVRLYEDSELKRLNIEPEILRSSLDLVVLQLIRLNLPPTTFPFMDQPKRDVINNSIDLLTRLKCIDNQKVTRTGELFTELGLDPRLSAFIVGIYTEYESLLELTASIVAILSAPGIIFFIGGTQEAKQEAKARIALQAREYKSDLIHLYSVYDAWKNARTTETKGECSACKKLVLWCTCRVKYSNDNHLNNKILKIIDTSCTSIIRQIKNARWLKAGAKMPENLMEIIGKSLAELFPEQCAYLLIPTSPTEGVRLVSTDIRAKISNTSVFMQKLHRDTDQTLYQYFVAMSITQIPSGQHIVEKLHPIPKPSAAIESTIENLMIIENISCEISHHMRQKLKTDQSQPWAKKVVYKYDRVQCHFIIWGPNTDKAMIIPVVQRVRNEVLKNFLDKYELLDCGPIKASFASGLICTHINKMTNVFLLALQNVPDQTPDELKGWLKKIAGIEWNEIENSDVHIAKDQSKRIHLTFKNEDAFRRATNKVPPYHISEPEEAFGMRRDNGKETWGRELSVQTPSNITVQDVIGRYGANVVMQCVQLNKENDKPRVESSLKLNNLPLTSNETFLRECLQKAGGPIPKHVRVEHASNDGSGSAKVTFSDQEQRNKAATIYELKLCQSSFPITYMGNKGLKQKFLETKVEKDDDVTAQTQPNSPPQNRFRITFISREATVQIFSSQTAMTTNLAAATSVSNPVKTSEWIVDGSATVTILRTDLYPDFQQIVDRICDKFEVEVEIKDESADNKRCTFKHGSPQKTSLAASMLAKNFATMNITLNTDRQKQLFTELEEVGEIQKWARELCLAINKNKWNTNIEIRGPQIAQGQLMRRIADYSDSFNQRYREYELSASISEFFSPQKAASGKLQQIATRYASKFCLVSFIPRTSTIIINGKPKVSLTDMNECEKEVGQLLNEMTVTMNDEETEDDTEKKDVTNNGTVRQGRRCVFCKQQSSISTSLFRICGHAYCRCAAQTLSTSVAFPLQCKDCKSNIHISDIQIIFNNDKQLLMHLLKMSIQNYLTVNAQQDDRVFCPNNECDGLIKLKCDYQTCLTCGESVCPKCQVMDDELHVGRTCAQLAEEKKRRQFLPHLFIAAKKFVQDNWPLDTEMQPIGRIFENPYLKKEHKSLRRFYDSIEILGHTFPPDLAKGFFAYHGTPFQAITSICQNGFDPKRRSGQAYGRGEYFGITAKISHGYSQKGGSQPGFSQMIIAFLLRSTKITMKENFCYVVDNPIDWKYTFTLPVLIVTYGKSAINQPSPFPDVIPDSANDESPWNAPFRWYWRQNTTKFEPYNDTINEILEKFYEQWKLHEGPSKVVTPPLTRYVDDIPQTYQIDYQNNRQTNIKTSYPRAIDRRPMDKPPDNQNWFYRNEQGNWLRYESLVQNSIETAFQSYRSGKGPSTIDIQFPGRPETY